MNRPGELVDDAGVKTDRPNPQLQRLHRWLQTQIERHAAVGVPIKVIVGAKRKPKILHRVGYDRELDKVVIFYGATERGNYALAFTAEKADTFTYWSTGFLGFDEDRDRVRIDLGLRVTRRKPAKPKRDVVRSSALETTRTTLQPSLRPLLHPAIARAMVFQMAPLLRKSPWEPGQAWDIAVELGRARSNSPRLWAEHRCALEYIIGESIKHGLALKVPGAKLMNSMNMRFTKGSIEFGKQVMRSLCDTTIEVHGGVDPQGRPTWQPMRLIESFDWSDDGGVSVVVDAQAAATFVPASSERLRAYMAKQGCTEWWNQWLCGLVANQPRLLMSRADICALAGSGFNGADKTWHMLTEFPATDEDHSELWCLFSELEPHEHSKRLGDSLVDFDLRTPEARFRQRKLAQERAHQKLLGGEFVRDSPSNVAWRRVGQDHIELARVEIIIEERQA